VHAIKAYEREEL